MDQEEHKPRVTVDITKEQEVALKEMIPHGLKKRMFGFIIDDMITIMSDPRKRFIFLGAMAARDLRLEDWLKVPKTTLKKLY